MKTKLFFVLLLFISLFAMLSAEAQDTRIYIGKAWLRYDSDSARLRIGGNPFPKLARELNTELFDFNTDNFTWDRTKGLCLKSISQYDSTKTRKLIIFADTGDGELIPYRSRSYTIFKPFYANNPDLYDLIIRYVSNNDISGRSTMTDINLINNVYELCNIVEQTDITGIGYNPGISSFPRTGLYICTLNYEYEYANSIEDNTDDINIVISFGGSTLREYHHSWKHSRFDGNNLRAPACITFPIQVFDVTKKIDIQIFGNNAPVTRLYIYNFNLSAILIN